MTSMKKEEHVLAELQSHYQAWNEDVDKRMSRKFGWKDITDTYYGVLPNDWPFETKVVDPRVRTILIEKNARITGGRITGRVVPREDSDVIKARILQQLLEYQWQMADEGGSMQVKLSMCDMDARLYGSKFALVEWRVKKSANGTILYEGNELKPLDIRDCGIDPSASHIKDAKWFQLRQWVYLEDLEQAVDSEGNPLFSNLSIIRKKRKEKISDTRVEYNPRILQIQGREDYVGKDKAFPMIKIVTEYRRDRWITFSPTYNVIVRDIENPYSHGRIPIAQLRYHPLQDDPLGESEVEGVIPLWRAIQAVLCAFLDGTILELNKPLKIIEGQARLETIIYKPQAQWLVTNPNAVVEHHTSTSPIQYFQATYLALVSALHTAMGAQSQGVSNIDPTESKRTATEIKASLRQQTAVDQKNLVDFGEFIKDIVSMWVSNNQQFLFSNPDKQYLIVKVIGKENWEFFKKAGFSDTSIPFEAQEVIADIIRNNPDITEDELNQLLESATLPKNAVVLNPKEKNPAKLKFASKLEVKEIGNEADLYITKEDIEGQYDFIPDIKLMTTTFLEEKQQARQSALTLLTTNPTVLTLLQEEGYTVHIKELLETILEDAGLSDPEKYFKKHEQPTQGNVEEEPHVLRGPLSNFHNEGMAGSSETLPSLQNQQPMGEPIGLQNA